MATFSPVSTTRRLRGRALENINLNCTEDSARAVLKGQPCLFYGIVKWVGRDFWPPSHCIMILDGSRRTGPPFAFHHSASTISSPLSTISHLSNVVPRRHTPTLPGTPLAARLIWRSHPIEPLVFHGRASRIAPDSAADHTSSAVAAALIPGAGRRALLCTSCETCQPQTPRSRCGRRQPGGENHGRLSYMQARAALIKMRCDGCT